MKRMLILLTLAVSVTGAAFATPVPETQQSCATDDNAGPLRVGADATGDSVAASVCSDDADFPVEGNISVNADASRQCAVASIDGDPENPYLDFDMDGGGNLDGYAALEIDADSATPVGVEESEINDYRSDCVSD